MKNLPVFLMGCGGVGRQLLQHIVSCRSLHAKQGLHLRVVGVCDSKSLVVVADVLTSEFDDSFLLEVCRVKSNGSSLQTLANSGVCQVFSGPEVIRKVIDIGLLGKSTGLAFVDCSASAETIGVLNQVVDFGCCVVLANKKPLTVPMEDYDKLVSQPRRLRHESTALILARLLGRRLNLDNMKIESLYPEEMGPDVMPLEDFLVNGLPLLDQKIEDRIKQASANGNVLRYVCLIDDARCEVGIQQVPNDSALGRLRGSDNVVEIYSRCYEKQPLVIQGAGAGNDTTAAGVLADILDIQDLFP
ncbi:uncharacterized protein LOC125832903 isoform X2 [Solanum verrucosum]|uniref:uncharacterized protein LOC125832903 isoform X2 n=1 Tax=Solanum verrucosum TaxID=315347 RepID=UPI0020D0BB9F|nr:uncharacterized protein LOC125832903 isoform X2 [Solanum verrucosum]